MVAESRTLPVRYLVQIVQGVYDVHMPRRKADPNQALVREALDVTQWPQSRLAKELGRSRHATVSDWLTGKTTPPSDVRDSLRHIISVHRRLGGGADEERALLVSEIEAFAKIMNLQSLRQFHSQMERRAMLDRAITMDADGRMQSYDDRSDSSYPRRRSEGYSTIKVESKRR